jgi:predicted ATPase/transcriptional regulator with XRE-family HTH domain/predicted negative regulator of RcsB-dependent stress response
MVSQQSFGIWLKLKRKSLDLTREGLAERVGCSAATIRKIEAEERRPSKQIAERLSDIFHIPQNERGKFLRFARGDLIAVFREDVEEAPWRSSSIPPHSNVPAMVTSLIGRGKEISDLREYLSNPNTRLITLIGPPGIGKTRLSMETASESIKDFRDGVFFVSLVPLDDASLIAPTIVQTLGYVEKRNLSDIDVLRDGIGDKSMLLVLDNCEHLIEDIAPLASRLLSACPRLKILATSRESLRVPGEHLYPVPTLDIPTETSSIDINTAMQFPALTLFTERAHAVRSDFSLNRENIQVIVSICSQLDGLPLAIELIASRIRLMSPQALLQRMSGQFVLSADGMRAVSARQRTLHNAIDWSYQYLPPEEQKIFACLSVFSGGFTLDAAEAVFAGMVSEKSVSEIIASLSDKSLLVRITNSQGDIRFNMLFTIHEFALERLRQTGLEADIRDRHMSYFLDFAEQTDREIHGPKQVDLLNRVEEDHDNFRAALGLSVVNQKTESALRLLGALGWPWEMRCYYTEARSWLDKIRTLPDLGNYPALYSKILNHIGRHTWTQENFHEAYSLLNESLVISAKAGKSGEQSLAEALNWMGLVTLLAFKNTGEAKSLLERGLELHKKLDDRQGIALTTFHLGILELEMDHKELALHILKQSLALFQQSGDQFFTGRVSIYLGYLFMKQEKYDQALHFFEQQLRIDTELQFWDGIANGWFHLGDLYRQGGDHEKAKAHYEQCKMICREHGLIKFVP